MAGTITHEWDGTTLIITSDSGTSSCNLKGDKGDMGIRGAQAPAFEGLSIYPVGSIFISTINTSPASTMGGTWQQIKDRFLLAAGDTYAAGSTGGAATHTHRGGSMAASIDIYGESSQVRRYGVLGVDRVSLDVNTSSGEISYRTHFLQDNETLSRNVQGEGVASGGYGAKVYGKTGNGSSLPPYVAVYAWKRVA